MDVTPADAPAPEARNAERFAPPPSPVLLAIGVAVTLLAVPESWRGWPYAPFPVVHAAAAIAIPLAYGAWPTTPPWPEVRDRLRGQAAPVAAAIGFVACFVAGYALLLAATGTAGDPAADLVAAYRDLWDRYVDRHGPVTVVLAAYLLVGVWPMFGEELFYRGFLLRGLLGSMTAAAASVTVSALFGLRHAAQLVYLWPDYPAGAGVAYFVWSCGLSLVLCWVYVRTRSLWTCMALHAVNLVLVPPLLLALTR